NHAGDIQWKRSSIGKRDCLRAAGRTNGLGSKREAGRGNGSRRRRKSTRVYISCAFLDIVADRRVRRAEDDLSEVAICAHREWRVRDGKFARFSCTNPSAGGLGEKVCGAG